MSYFFTWIFFRSIISRRLSHRFKAARDRCAIENYRGRSYHIDVQFPDLLAASWVVGSGTMVLIENILEHYDVLTALHDYAPRVRVLLSVVIIYQKWPICSRATHYINATISIAKIFVNTFCNFILFHLIRTSITLK